MRIRVSGLSNGLHEYRFTADPANIGLDGRFHTSVEVDARLDKASRQMYLTTAIHAAARFECDRCLDEFEGELKTGYGMFYVYDEADAGMHPDDEVTVISPDAVHIDITDDVRQLILLAVPLKLLCDDACKGLCPVCGTNLNHGECPHNAEARPTGGLSGLRDAMNKQR